MITDRHVKHMFLRIKQISLAAFEEIIYPQSWHILINVQCAHSRTRCLCRHSNCSTYTIMQKRELHEINLKMCYVVCYTWVIRISIQQCTFSKEIICYSNALRRPGLRREGYVRLLLIKFMWPGVLSPITSLLLWYQWRSVCTPPTTMLSCVSVLFYLGTIVGSSQNFATGLESFCQWLFALWTSCCGLCFFKLILKLQMNTYGKKDREILDYQHRIESCPMAIGILSILLFFKIIQICWRKSEEIGSSFHYNIIKNKRKNLYPVLGLYSSK